MRNHAKDKLARGELVLCMGLRQARSADIPMIAAQAGFDAIHVDQQHSPLSLDTAALLCAGALGAGITPLVRPPSHARDQVSRALDAGAQGVLMADVESGEQAQAIVDAALYPPLGHRSVMGSGPALGYRGLPAREINATVNAQTLVVCMVETPAGVAAADAIAAVEGVDALLIGSNDLCTSLGIPGEFRHPRLREAYETVAQACRRRGKVLGVGGIRGDLELQASLLKLGARFLIAGNDTGYLAAAARKDADALRTIPL